MSIEQAAAEPLPDAAAEPLPDVPESPEVDTEQAPDEQAGRLPRVLRRPRVWAVAALAVALVAGWSLAGYYRHTSDVHGRADATDRAAVHDLTGRLQSVTQDRDTYKSRADQMQAREDAVKQREDQVQAREDAVKKREDAMTQAEQVQAQNTIHEGTWAVGVDVQPGTYRTKDPVAGQCYWGIYSDANGSNIVANDIVTGGRPTVTLKGGQYFTTTRCGDWAKVS